MRYDRAFAECGFHARVRRDGSCRVAPVHGGPVRVRSSLSDAVRVLYAECALAAAAADASGDTWCAAVWHRRALVLISCQP